MVVENESSVNCRGIHPKRKHVERLVVGFVLSILGKSFASASRFQKEVQREVSNWPDGFSFVMRVDPDGPSIILVKERNVLIFRRKKIESSKADLVITFKNMKSAFLLLTAQMSTVRGYCEKRMSVSGDVMIATSIIRCMNIIETYLFPRIIARKVVKRIPDLPFLSKTLGRIRIYTTGLLFGR